MSYETSSLLDEYIGNCSSDDDHDDDDNNSFSTQITSNVSRRRRFVDRWGLPILIFIMGMTLIVKDQHNRPLIPTKILRSWNYRRELYSPYDTSRDRVLPAWTDALADVWEPVTLKQTDESQPRQIPFFWSVPRAGAGTITKIFSHCLGLALACNKGIATSNTTLGVYTVEPSTPSWMDQYPHPARYVNVKTNSEAWIQKCRDRGLVQSGFLDVLVTSHLTYAATQLFQTSHNNNNNNNEIYHHHHDAHQKDANAAPPAKARAFVMMRHPVKRVIDHFLYQQYQEEKKQPQSTQQQQQQRMTVAVDHDDPSQQSFSTTTRATLSSSSLSSPFQSLAAFVDSDQMVDNYEVRMLNGILDTQVGVTGEHLEIAKDVLRRKFLIGIYDWFDVSMVRYEKYFGWWKQMNVLHNMTINNCHYTIIESDEDEDDDSGSYHLYATSKPENGEFIYTSIMRRSWADMELYRHAKYLFAEQAKLL